MSEKLPVSAHILTWNSGKTLRLCLESVRQCAEILVIDGGSTDSTVSIAKECGALIISQRESKQGTPTVDFAAARNRGLDHATQPWILALDSDETASPELLREMTATIAAGLPCACFVPRRYLLLNGRIVTHATTYPNARLSFFHRNVVKTWEKPVHERPVLQPNTLVQYLRGVTLAPLGNPEDYRRKNLRYLAIEQEKDQGKGWWHWLRHRVLHTIRSRSIALGKLLWIWGFPHRNCVRLPLHHEFLRFWYGWKLIVVTCPLSIPSPRGRACLLAGRG